MQRQNRKVMIRSNGTNKTLRGFIVKKQFMKKIKSSDGKKEYLVTKNSCTCKSFEFRKTCKHIKMLKPEYKLLEKLRRLRGD